MKANIQTYTGLREVEVERIITIGETKCFVHLCDDIDWRVSEWTSGYCVAHGNDDEDDEDYNPHPTIEEMIKLASDRILRAGPEKTKDRIRKAIEATGIANETTEGIA
jgi:hypothetical protein